MKVDKEFFTKAKEHGVWYETVENLLINLVAKEGVHRRRTFTKIKKAKDLGQQPSATMATETNKSALSKIILDVKLMCDLQTYLESETIKLSQWVSRKHGRPLFELVIDSEKFDRVINGMKYKSNSFVIFYEQEEEKIILKGSYGNVLITRE